LTNAIIFKPVKGVDMGAYKAEFQKTEVFRGLKAGDG
jgi:putative ABC transport system permease protein